MKEISKNQRFDEIFAATTVNGRDRELEEEDDDAAMLQEDDELDEEEDVEDEAGV
jgi:hypothetical protein